MTRTGYENLCDGYLSGPLRGIEQTARIAFRVALAEDRAAGNQQLGSRFDDAPDRIVSDPAVDLNPIT